MTKAALKAIIGGLNAAGVRYLVVGGLAVNAHGFVRSTMDIDLIVSLERENLLKGLAVLKALGYVPKVPVAIEDFADEEKRKSWVEEKHMVVFGLRSPLFQETTIDIFVTDPLGFEQAHARAFIQRLESDAVPPVPPSVDGAPNDSRPGDAMDVPFCSFQDLIYLKQQAGRRRDLDDIERLHIVRGEQ